MVAINECPMQYVGESFIEAANLAVESGGGDWPVAGGLLDQAGWFLQLHQRLKAERNQIEAEELAASG